MANTLRPPFVGPRALTEADGIYGRDWDRARLRDLLFARRIVLMHSPSGAGKTSLIQAGLIPLLREKGITVFGPVRPGISQRAGTITAGRGQTRYGISMLLQLDDTLPEDKRSPPEQIAGMSILEYLKHCRDVIKGDAERAGPGIVVIDQFEEVLTFDPTDSRQKMAFFRDLGAALRQSDVMVLFSIREDYVGSLEPFLDLLPTRLETRFRLDMLGEHGAMQAIQNPARSAGVKFQSAAARQVWKSLSEVRVLEPDGSTTVKQGPYVEAVQLQVVCKQLWDADRPDAGQITADDVRNLGQVDDALGYFFSDAVAAALQASAAKPEPGTPQPSERKIREWVETRFITSQGLRGQVMEASEALDDMPREVIRSLVNSYVLREEPRRGMRFYELSHDRLILPIRRDNRKWIESHYTSLAAQADRWKDSNRSDDLLLNAETAAKAQPESKLELEYVVASKKYRIQEERHTRELEGRTNLAVTGWGVIFASDSDPKIREALQPLLAHRKQQAAASNIDRYREFSGPLGYRQGESAERFLTRNGATFGLQNTSLVPYYLLIVGDPQAIPFDFHFGLSSQYAVGRLDLDTPEQYSIYARSVVASESKDFALPRRVGIFAPRHESDPATEMTSRLSYPFAERLKAYAAWTVQAPIRDEATKQRLRSMLTGDAAPILLFFMGRGVQMHQDTERQKAVNGALICQDWEVVGAISDPHWFAANDLADDSRVLGSVLCLIAPFSAATPEFDEFSFGTAPRRKAAQSFTASLPKRLLAHPNGGALAVIGHVDTNWEYSLVAQDKQTSSGLFEGLCINLMSGYTIGSAMTPLGQRALVLASSLVDGFLSAPTASNLFENKKLLANMVALRDARNYIILGDPATRLAVTSDVAVSTRPILPSELPAAGRASGTAVEKVPSEDVLFNGFNVLSNEALLPTLSLSELSKILRGLSLDANQLASFRRWYDVAARGVF